MPTIADTYELDEGAEVLRLGGVVPATSEISWLPPGVTGWVPLHCYLVRAGRGGGRELSVLIDTSFPVIESEVVGQLDAAVGRGGALVMILTRQAEYESIGNVAAILQGFTVPQAWGSTEFEEWPYFSPRFSPPAQLEPGPWWPHGDEVRTASFLGLDGITAGHQRFDLINAPIRLLATEWIYHARSGTLFTSDSFAAGCLVHPDDAPVVDTVVWDTEILRSYLLAKFRWVERANVAPLIHRLDDILARLDVRCVAPAHGWIVRGPAARQLLADHRAVLAEYCQPTAPGIGQRAGDLPGTHT